VFAEVIAQKLSIRSLDKITAHLHCIFVWFYKTLGGVTDNRLPYLSFVSRYMHSLRANPLA
jgi:hypothetical protein